MFRINCDVIKSSVNKNKLHVVGVASAPVIDSEEEMFSAEAIAKMTKQVNQGGIPIRVEHQDKYYSDIGVWTSATLDKDNKMIVEGDVDLEFSFGSDLEVVLRKGGKVALSVGGRVVDAAYEWVKELNKSIRVYRDVVLQEISLVRNPANPVASLSIAKSLDSETLKKEGTVKPTTEAQKLIQYYKSMEKFQEKGFGKAALSSSSRAKLPDAAFAYVATDAKGKKVRKLPIHDAAHVRNALAVLGGARGGVKGIPDDEMDAVRSKVEAAAKKFGIKDTAKACKQPKKKEMMKSLESWVETVAPKVAEVIKDGYAEPSEDCGSVGMTPADYANIGKLMAVMSQVELPDDLSLSAADEQLYNEIWMSAGEDAFILLSDRYPTMPHHNLDYTVNETLLLYQLKRFCDSQGGYKPKDYTIVLNHLYQHLKELSLVKSGKSYEAILQKETSLTPSDVMLLAKCDEYMKGLSDEKPKAADGTEMPDELVVRSSKAFDKLATSQISHIVKNLSMSDELKKDLETEETTPVETPVEEPKTEETPVETPVETPAETPVETPAETPAEVPTEAPVEKSTEETPAEAPVAPEAPAEEPKPATDPAPVEAPAETPAPAEAPVEAPTEPVQKDEATPVEKPTEETPAAVPATPAEETPVETAPVETPAPAPEAGEVKTEPEPTATVEVKVDAEEVSKALKAFKDSAEEISKSISANVEKSMSDKFGKAVSDLTDLVNGVVEKTKGYDALEKNVTKMAELVSKLAERSLGRKAVAIYSQVERSAEGDKPKTALELAAKFMDEGMSFQEAYAKAKVEFTQQG